MNWPDPPLTSLRLTTIVTLFLFIKFLVTTAIQGSKRFDAGARPPEDDSFGIGTKEHNFKGTNPEDVQAQEAEMRWTRIVMNDLESMPFAIGIAILDALCGSNAIAHMVLYGVYFLARLLHTISYANSAQPWRSITYFVGVLCIIGMGLNSIVGLWVQSG